MAINGLAGVNNPIFQASQTQLQQSGQEKNMAIQGIINQTMQMESKRVGAEIDMWTKLATESKDPTTRNMALDKVGNIIGKDFSAAKSSPEGITALADVRKVMNDKSGIYSSDASMEIWNNYVSQWGKEHISKEDEESFKGNVEAGYLGQASALSRQTEATPGLAQSPEIMGYVQQEQDRLLTGAGTKGQEVLAAGMKQEIKPEKDENEFQTFKQSFLQQHPNASGIDVVKAYKEQSAGVDRPATRAQTAAIGHSLRGELRQNPYVKDYQTMDSKFTAMEKALEASKKSNNFVAIDQAIITLYNKILDPSSVVRESEYARTPENLSLWSRFKGKVDKYGAGGAGITQDDRQALVDMALQIRDSYEQSYNETIDDYSALAKEVGVSEKLIGIPFRKGNKGGNKPSNTPSDRTVTRTGTDRKTGKKVIQYSDGSVEYGN